MEYISSTITAKYIRNALKKAFPGVKFKVRSDRGAVNIHWVDGPTDAQVSAVVGVFEGNGFDGSIDMSYSRTAFILADGTVVSGNTSGTTGSLGYVDPIKNELPKGAQEVMFTTWVFTHRHFSEKFMHNALISFRAKWGNDVANLIKISVGYENYAYATCSDYAIERDFQNHISRRVIAQ